MKPRLLSLAGFLALAGCGGERSEASTLLLPNTGVTSVSVSPNGMTMAVGDSLRFTATPTRNLTVTGMIWSTSNFGVASVDSFGFLRSRAAGTVSVYACTRPTTSVCGSATVTIR